jgi:transcriptional regulator GlxA family with amidase domain
MSVRLQGARGGSPASAQVPSSLPPPDCSTAAVPRRIGAAPPSSHAPIRKSASSPIASLSDDGAVWTSAGITAGIDLALALVAEDLGEATAKRTAQQLVVYHRRPGGQSQFSALLEVDRPGSRFSPVLAWARERLGERLPVERLADRAAMSPRHFARAFAAETGMTPAKAIERLRLEASREWIESGSDPIERVAACAGFGDPERMRRAFIRAFGQPPQALRRTAKLSGAGRPV